MVTNTTGRIIPLWAIALLVATAVAVGLTFGATAQAQIETDHRAADLHLTKTVKPRVVPVGTKQTYIIKVTNERGERARAVKMIDQLPKGVNFVRASTSRQVPGSCDKSGRTVVCRLGDLRVGRSVTIEIVVKPVNPGRYVNRAYVEHSTAELQSSDNVDIARARASR
jgi:uncharacterized repeat protein (TIGR01451 family)